MLLVKMDNDKDIGIEYKKKLKKIVKGKHLSREEFRNFYLIFYVGMTIFINSILFF